MLRNPITGTWYTQQMTPEQEKAWKVFKVIMYVWLLVSMYHSGYENGYREGVLKTIERQQQRHQRQQQAVEPDYNLYEGQDRYEIYERMDPYKTDVPFVAPWVKESILCELVIGNRWLPRLGRRNLT